MGAEQKTHFQIDKTKCIKCGNCINTCSGMVIGFGPDGYPQMKEFERFGWRGCLFRASLQRTRTWYDDHELFS